MFPLFCASLVTFIQSNLFGGIARCPAHCFCAQCQGYNSKIVRYYLISTEASCYPFLPLMAAVATATHIKCWSLSKLIILILKVDLHPEQDAAFSTIKYKSQLSMALVDMQNSSFRGAQNPFGQKDLENKDIKGWVKHFEPVLCPRRAWAVGGGGQNWVRRKLSS